MNRADFTRELSKKTNLSKAKALEVTNAMLEIISKTLSEKEKIQFVEFGTFEVRYSPERAGRNPQTNEPAIVPARYRAVFKPSKCLSDSINVK